jgi:hypothetical protein
LEGGHPRTIPPKFGSNYGFFFILQESDVAKHLRMMLMALSFPKPPANITGFQMFSKVENKVVL